jgi:alpha-N-arabinofuranosidase
VPTSSITNAGDRFFYSVTNDAAKGLVYLKLVNAASHVQTIDVSLSGAGSVAHSASLVTLSGKTTAETNSISDPRRIVPVKSSIQAGDTFSHTMPPYSIQVIVVEAK